MNAIVKVLLWADGWPLSLLLIAGVATGAWLTHGLMSMALWLVAAGMVGACVGRIAAVIAAVGCTAIFWAAFHPPGSF